MKPVENPADKIDSAEPSSRKKPRYKARIIKDPITGFPAIDLGPDAPILTSERVKELLADFP
jgi:hypothetical protein